MFRRRHKYDYDLIVIGSGAGGSVGAHYAHSLGKKVAVFEKAEVGGECPNWACVPTKALLHAAKIYQLAQNSEQFGIDIKDPALNHKNIKKWRDLVVSRTGVTHGEEIFKKEGLHLIKEKASFINDHEVEAGGKIYSAAKFLIATGSTVAIPPINGLNESSYITFKEAGSWQKIPKSIFILGAGPVGCEFAQIYATFGTKVTLADSLDKLIAKEDKEVSDLIQALFENQGIDVLTGITVDKVEKKPTRKVVYYQKDGRHHELNTQEILVSTGKRPVLDFAPEKAGIIVENGRLKINKYLQTSVSHIFAAGDVIGPYLLTHTGEYQSYIAAKNAFSYQKTRPSYDVVPRCVFTYPEVASVGLSARDAKEQGIRIKVGIFAMSALGRANMSNDFDGFVKIVTDKKETIIGASIVAPRAGEMIHELALAVKLKVKAKVIAEMIHAYPTFSEAIKFAASSLEEK
ncbi:NAD(P)/FAD-dependent oxidoreductase [Candidatus Curtissbacteria bacterium]|nr:NAD(P)/FAD-dependent oxidoreductase [Candidatus Curtissbacteria bacterium]